MRVTCERCLRRYDLPDATVKGRKLRARCKCGARVVVEDVDRITSGAASSHTTGAIQRPVRWFVDITSWEPIAMDLRQLVKAFDAGRIDADTLVWRKGMPDWSRLRDVAELAERLIGTEALPKLESQPAPAEGSDADVSPRVERSRTPPANYAVAEQASAGETAAAATPNGAGTERGISAAGERRSVPVEPAPDATEPGAPRTITHVGLETPAAVLARTSSPPPAAEPAPASRAQRSSSSLAAVAPRRPPSNDETPAQKPSSISLPPPATGAGADTARGRGFIALAAIVLGAGALWLAFGTERPVARTPLPVEAPATAVRPPTRVNPSTPPPSSAEGPVEPEATSSQQPAAAPAPVVAEESKSTVLAPPAVSTPQTAPPSPTSVAAPPAPVARPANPVAKPRPAAVPAVRPSEGVAPVAPSPGADAKSAMAAPPAPRTETAAPIAPSPSTVPSVTSPVVKSSEASAPPANATPAAIEEPAPASLPSAAEKPAAEFDAFGAEEQMVVAARKAAACSQAGGTRGSGRVSVIIEPWGRVSRVTHLEQAFVGTPVGICVMQAFQQVRVAPFEGGPRSLTGFFVVE